LCGICPGAKALRLFYSDLYTIPLPEGHKFPMHKYGALRAALEGDPRFEFSVSPLADREDIELAHDPEYVRRFLEGGLSRQEIRRIGFPWSDALVTRTLASAGGTLAAAKEAWESGCSGALAGGTHHAYYGEGSGFCVFNDIAIGILWLREYCGVKRAAVVDLDVHQGDGTAAIFVDDDDVYTLSVHGEKNFPLRKQVSRRDVGLVDGVQDAEYLEIVRRELPAVFDFRPDIVFFQAGVDGLITDRLGRLELTHQGLLARDRMVLAACLTRGIPVVITIGGGYSDPIEPTIEAHAGTFRTAAEVCDNDKSFL
jgi:acetoin utilization deacetylase AcuC-like enzyme